MKSLPNVAGWGSLISTCQIDLKIDTTTCFSNDSLVLANVLQIGRKRKVSVAPIESNTPNTSAPASSSYLVPEPALEIGRLIGGSAK